MQASKMLFAAILSICESSFYVLVFIGVISSAQLRLIRFILLLWYTPFLTSLKQLVFFYFGCFWDFLWIVGSMLSLVVSETEAMEMGLSSSSIEVMPSGIGSELEGRPEILRMDQNDQQAALPLNPHAPLV